MSDPDRIRQREHWQAIAEQLGLAREPEQPQSLPEIPAERPVEEKPFEAPPELVDRETATSRFKEVANDSAAEQTVPQTISQPHEWTGKAPLVPLEGPTDEEIVPPQRERRGRPQKTRSSRKPEGKRSRRGSGADVPDEGVGTEAKRRTRGHGRKRKDRSLEEPGESLPFPNNAEPRAATEQMDADDEDAAVTGSWNVPSWSELIDSLYRPER